MERNITHHLSINNNSGDPIGSDIMEESADANLR